MSNYDKNSIKSRASDKDKEVQDFFKKLKRKKPRDLDMIAKKLHEEVFQEIDCLDCANCCRSISPFLIDKDITRISAHLKIKPAQLTEKYLRMDREGDYVFNTSPCPFLMNDNYCMIYEKRPRACREYPHTDRNRFIQILDLTRKNSFVCPAVQLFIEKLMLRYKDL